MGSCTSWSICSSRSSLETARPGQRRLESGTSDRTAVRSPEDAGSTWKLTLLGDFAIERDGARFDLPQSVSTQALKLLAVRRRVTVDELVDILWPESDNDIGSRRLRNVLWRIRGASGDLVRRDGNLICLAESASTDVEDFEPHVPRPLELLPRNESQSSGRAGPFALCRAPPPWRPLCRLDGAAP